MKKEHKIGWLNLPGYKGETWNPIIGCSKVSDGCKNCYAERMAGRLAHMPGAYEYSNVVSSNPTKWNGKTQLVQSAIDKPLRWKKPRVIFVCSMGDLFHEDTSFQDIDKVFTIMACNPQHIFIVLTKRAKRMAEYYNSPVTRANIYYLILKSKNSGYAVTDPLDKDGWPLKNVWLGVTAENQETANDRLLHLIKTPAALKFISVEPIVGPVDLTAIKEEVLLTKQDYLKFKFLTGKKFEGPKIDWVICGGESGPGARPMHPDWVRSLRDQCQEAGVPFFFKQWGEFVSQHQGPKVNQLSKDKWFSVSTEGDYGPLYETSYMKDGLNYRTVGKIGRKAAGNLLDGEKWEQYPDPELLKKYTITNNQ